MHIHIRAPPACVPLLCFLKHVHGRRLTSSYYRNLQGTPTLRQSTRSGSDSALLEKWPTPKTSFSFTVAVRSPRQQRKTARLLPMVPTRTDRIGLTYPKYLTSSMKFWRYDNASPQPAFVACGHPKHACILRLNDTPTHSAALQNHPLGVLRRDFFNRAVEDCVGPKKDKDSIPHMVRFQVDRATDTLVSRAKVSAAAF